MAIVPYLASAFASLTVFSYLISRLYPWIKYDLLCLRDFIKTGIRLKRIEHQGKLLCDLFEENADQVPKKTCLIFQDEHYSYEFADKQMNKMAHAAMAVGIKKGGVVAVMLHNEPAFIWLAYGLYKLGAQPAFINYNLRSKSLLHCVNVSESRILLVGGDENLIVAVREIYPELKAQGIKVYVVGVKGRSLPEDFLSFDDAVNEATDDRLSVNWRDGITLSSAMCYIYTSGTTGFPKAAIVTQMKGLKGAALMEVAKVGKNDIIYTPLPLYHAAGGLIALGAMVFCGATLVLSSKFSASHFMEDCRKHKVTVIQYIGELCRYLCATPKSQDDRNHCIRVAVGNGLRQDIWREFTDRFNIPFIFEFYAATEGNVGLVNGMNKFGSVGRCSPLLKLLMPIYFIKYDIVTEQPVRDKDGFCIQVGFNEPGLMVGLIKKNFTFEGYKGNKTLTEKKILRNVFKKGDLYFNSGDLLEVDREYFVYFKERIGDTFRWKGENVSTSEVANVLTDVSWIQDANVYGVEIPGQDGRAGMVSLSLVQGHDLTNIDLGAIFNQCSRSLPSYAWPRFLRVQDKQQVTSTFKLKKVDLVREGFDPEKVNPGPVYYLDLTKKAYIPLTDESYHDIISGKIRL